MKKFILGLFFIFLLTVTFVCAEKADYLFYEEDLQDLLDDENDDCNIGLPGAYIGMSTEFKICEERSYCTYGYTICEDGVKVERQDSKNCEACDYGCYQSGCYDTKVTCDDPANCVLGADEVIDFDEYLLFGVVNMVDPSWGLYRFNINGGFRNVGDDIGKRQEFYSSPELPYDYFITLTKVRDDHIEFSIERLEKECVTDSDCKDKSLLSCDGGNLSNQITTYTCRNEACNVKTQVVDRTICEYKCENKSCVNCDGCVVDNTCFSPGPINDTAFCSEAKSLEDIKLPKESCENDYECSLSECVEDSCKDYGFWEKIGMWFRNLF